MKIWKETEKNLNDNKNNKQLEVFPLFKRKLLSSMLHHLHCISSLTNYLASYFAAQLITNFEMFLSKCCWRE